MNASLGGQWIAKHAELRSVVRTGTALSWKPGTPSNWADAVELQLWLKCGELP